MFHVIVRDDKNWLYFKCYASHARFMFDELTIARFSAHTHTRARRHSQAFLFLLFFVARFDYRCNGKYHEL